ncbi:MAG: CopG family transcriptional regulator [Thermoproteota archaeon]|nr:MAG: CopG family transcriptional regulator [Candidatus Korarchaeota archaeon]
MKKLEKTEYVLIKIPQELAQEIDAILGKHGYRSRAEFVKDAIRSLLREYASTSSE